MKLSLVKKGGGEAHKGAVPSEAAMGSKACPRGHIHVSVRDRRWWSERAEGASNQNHGGGAVIKGS